MGLMCRARAKILVVQKREKNREGAGQRESWGLPASIPSLPHPLPAPFPFLLSPQFSRTQHIALAHTGMLDKQANSS